MTVRFGRRELAAVAVSAVAAWAVLGTAAVLVVVTMAVVVAVEGLRPASRHAALGSAACLAVAAVATVIEHPLAGEPRLQYATDRPFTAAVGSLAGGLLVSAMVLGWAGRVDEESDGRAEPPDAGVAGADVQDECLRGADLPVDFRAGDFPAVDSRAVDFRAPVVRLVVAFLAVAFFVPRLAGRFFVAVFAGRD